MAHFYEEIDNELCTLTKFGFEGTLFRQRMRQQMKYIKALLVPVLGPDEIQKCGFLKGLIFLSLALLTSSDH